jgi:predicted GIY-YIG superfamily endonuclease
VCYVYVLYADKFNRQYIGLTADPEDRVLSFNVKAPKGLTVRYHPWRIVHLETSVTKRKHFFVKVG